MRSMQQASSLSLQKLAEQMHQPKCYGIAKNFFTNALKANPKLATPPYPLMFHKPFSW